MGKKLKKVYLISRSAVEVLIHFKKKKKKLVGRYLNLKFLFFFIVFEKL